MKRNNKKFIIYFFIFLTIILLIISIIISNNTKNDNSDKSEKIYYEIKYLDEQIIYIMNSLNNLNIKESNNIYINWNEIQNNTENLYNYWNPTILDLNDLNIDKNLLTDFGKNLDEITVSIKKRDKQLTLNNLTKLYYKIIKYYEALNYNESYRNILYSKYNLLIAYSIVEKGNWTLTYESILKSDEYLYNTVNSISNEEYYQYNINQAYIAVKELENIINVKDIDIFYIKYKIVINKLQNL